MVWWWSDGVGRVVGAGADVAGGGGSPESPVRESGRREIEFENNNIFNLKKI